jgi:hypothetical protein
MIVGIYLRIIIYASPPASLLQERGESLSPKGEGFRMRFIGKNQILKLLLDCE